MSGDSFRIALTGFYLGTAFGFVVFVAFDVWLSKRFGVTRNEKEHS